MAVATLAQSAAISIAYRAHCASTLAMIGWFPKKEAAAVEATSGRMIMHHVMNIIFFSWGERAWSVEKIKDQFRMCENKGNI